MDTSTISDYDIVDGLLEAAGRIERRLDGSLSTIKGISLREYQLLLALRNARESTATRVDLAAAVGLTPSGVTRALKPLEKLGFVEAVRDERDARRSLATLTNQGHELVSDAEGVVADSFEVRPLMAGTNKADRQQLMHLLANVG